MPAEAGVHCSLVVAVAEGTNLSGREVVGLRTADSGSDRIELAVAIPIVPEVDLDCTAAAVVERRTAVVVVVVVRSLVRVVVAHRTLHLHPHRRSLAEEGVRPTHPVAASAVVGRRIHLPHLADRSCSRRTAVVVVDCCTSRA